MRFFVILIALNIALFYSLPLIANDGAAEIALGGIRLKQERRVAMVKERLFISKKKVRVEYDFRNESNEDVTTEIAFPIPDYRCDLGYGWNPFDDFKVWINGVTTSYLTDTRAWVGDREVTGLLTAHGVNIATFGEFVEGRTKPDSTWIETHSQVDDLPKDDLERFVAAKIIEPPGTYLKKNYHPLWAARKTYYWSQTFPAGANVSIAHEYSPAVGEINNTTLDDLQHPKAGWFNFGAEGPCADAGLVKSIKGALAKRGKPAPNSGRIEGCFGASWVRYILTTANTWQTPILDFELIVERDPGEFITFCWDGPVEKVDANSFRARVKDFIPSKELTVYFLQP